MEDYSEFIGFAVGILLFAPPMYWLTRAWWRHADADNLLALSRSRIIVFTQPIPPLVFLIFLYLFGASKVDMIGAVAWVSAIQLAAYRGFQRAVAERRK